MVSNVLFFAPQNSGPQLVTRFSGHFIFWRLSDVYGIKGFDWKLYLYWPDYDYLGLGSKMCTIQWLNLTKTIYALKWSKLIQKSNFGYEIYVKFSKFLRGLVHFFKKLVIFIENRDFSTMWPKKSRKKLIFSLKIDFFQKIANFLKKPTPPRENIENFTQFS